MPKKVIAIIGTAGRDKSLTKTRSQWEWMVASAKELVPLGAHLVSGGAAWADHLAVHLMLTGHVDNLTLHLPAAFGIDKYKSSYAGNVANYYHNEFSKVIGTDTLKDIDVVTTMNGCDGTYQESIGAIAFKNRNTLIANMATECIAYGFTDKPSGGTLHTWNLLGNKPKQYIQIPY